MRDRICAEPESSGPRALLAVLAVFAALVFVAFVRLRLAGVPLERDEGEYAYAAQLILEGIPPYALAYNMKFPGTYYAYAMILALFGQTPRGIHLGLLFVNAATVLVVFAFGRRLLGRFAGGVAAVIFSILSLDRWVLGVFAHATHFVVLATLTGLLFLLRAIEDGRARWYLCSGVFLGLAVVMKQHAIFFVPLGAVLALASGSPGTRSAAQAPAKTIGLMALGVLIPLAVVAVVLLAQGVGGRFWFWTFRYAGVYVSELPLSAALPIFTHAFNRATSASLVFWVLGGLGLPALWISRWEPRVKVVLTGLLLTSFLAMCPGFYFRAHYFILVLPAVALLGGVAIGSLRQALDRVLPRGAARTLALLALVAAIGLYVTKEGDYLFSMGTRELSRSMFGTNPFVEAVEIGSYIRDRTNKNDRIAVLGSEPEIYFYADRKSATGYIYTYALMEPQPFAETMQREMIREIESVHPHYLVFLQIYTSWMAKKESDQAVIAWGNDYARRCYDTVGVVDIVSKGETHIAWDDEVRKYKPVSSDLIRVFRRKSDTPCATGR